MKIFNEIYRGLSVRDRIIFAIAVIPVLPAFAVVGYVFTHGLKSNDSATPLMLLLFAMLSLGFVQFIFEKVLLADMFYALVKRARAYGFEDKFVQEFFGASGSLIGVLRDKGFLGLQLAWAKSQPTQ